MTDTPDLFSPHRLARSCDPDTSHEAAERIAPKLRQKQTEVLQLFERSYKRLTAWDVENHFDDHGSTYRSRLPELEELGLLRRPKDASGHYIKQHQAGRNRVVWELA